MTDQERALQIAQARLDEADLSWQDAREAEKAAYSAWLKVDRLYQRVEAGDPDAIRQVLEGER